MLGPSDLYAYYIVFMQIPYCHQSTKKGEIVRAYLFPSGFGD